MNFRLDNNPYPERRRQSWENVQNNHFRDGKREEAGGVCGNPGEQLPAQGGGQGCRPARVSGHSGRGLPVGFFLFCQILFRIGRASFFYWIFIHKSMLIFISSYTYPGIQISFSTKKSCGSGSCISSESGSGSRVLMTKNWRKKYRLKIFVLSKIVIYFCPSYGRSHQPSKEKIQHSKKWNVLIFIYVCGSFLIFYYFRIQADALRFFLSLCGGRLSFRKSLWPSAHESKQISFFFLGT